MNKIKKYCKINKNTVLVDYNTIYSFDKNLQFSLFIRELYNVLELNYPKFFKMDNLCKLAIITSEILLKDTDILTKYDKEDIGVILSNASSSLDSDIKYQQTISDKDNYYPNPSVFVYTLPNIMIGEICIKYGIKGENTCFISEKFDKEFLLDYTELLIKNDLVKSAIFGWVEYSEQNFESELYLI